MQVPTSLDKYFMYHICFSNNNGRQVGAWICPSSLENKRTWHTMNSQQKILTVSKKILTVSKKFEQSAKKHTMNSQQKFHNEKQNDNKHHD